MHSRSEFEARSEVMAFNAKMDRLVFNLRDFVQEAKDRLLRQALLRHLGYLPTFADCKKFGKMMLSRDGTATFTWQNVPVVSWRIVDFALKYEWLSGPQQP